MVLRYITSSVESKFPKHQIRYINKKEGDESSIIEEIIKLKVPELYSGYWFGCNPLLGNGHAQTAYTALREFPDVDKVYYKRRILKVDSENKSYVSQGRRFMYDHWNGLSTFALDYVVSEDKSDPDHLTYKPESQSDKLPRRTEFLNPEEEDSIFDDDKPLLIALHGLSGGSYESYLRSVVHMMTNEPYNFDAVVLNARGCAEHTITSPQLFCGLWTNDLRYLINEHILKKWPNKRIYLVGFSLGGAITVNYVSQEGSEIFPNIKAAAALATPWDFNESFLQLSNSIIGNNIYSPKMCSNLVKLIQIHANGHLASLDSIKNYNVDPTKFKLIKLKDFDDVFTSKLFGFNCATEYYRHASPISRVLNVRVPLFMLNSLDDPIVGSRSLPYSEVNLNPYINLITTTVGGHLGWFDFKGERWYPKALSKLFSELDQNWELDKASVTPESLPLDSAKSFGYDRIL